MGLYHIGGKSYEIMHENRNGWNAEAFRDRYSEVLERYDYIVGDWGYNQLRLKGFFRDNHQKANKDSSFSTMSDYINEYCNFGCAYFVLEKIHGVKYEPEPDEPEQTDDVPRLEASDLRAAMQASLSDSVHEDDAEAEETLSPPAPYHERNGRKPRSDYRHGGGSRRGEDQRKNQASAQQEEGRSSGDKRDNKKREGHPRSEHRSNGGGSRRSAEQQRAKKPFRLASNEAAASLADDSGSRKKDTEGS